MANSHRLLHRSLLILGAALAVAFAGMAFSAHDASANCQWPARRA